MRWRIVHRVPALPFSVVVVAQDMNIAVFFMLAVMSTEVFGIILAAMAPAASGRCYGGCVKRPDGQLRSADGDLRPGAGASRGKHESAGDREQQAFH